MGSKTVGIRTPGRGFERLTALQVKRAKPGLHSDGGNLYLRVGEDASGRVTRQWTFRYTSPTHRILDDQGNETLVGKRREAGLGNAEKVSLLAARQAAAAFRDQLALKRDPLDLLAEQNAAADAVKQAEVAAKKASQSRQRNTLRRVCRDFHERLVEPIRTRKHGAQWINSIEQHLPARLLDAAVEEIEATDLLDALLKIRAEVPETARRISQRVGLVLADAKLRKIISNNPHADIRHALRESKRDRQKGRKNFSALPFAQLPDFITALQAANGLAAMALEFTIRCVSRTSETLGAVWDEIDLEKGIWVIPAERMKAREQHVVFLAERAMEILKDTKKLGAPHCFPSPTDWDQPLSNMAMLAVLKRMGLAGRATTHGFRSSFSTWAYEVAQRSRPDLARQDVIESVLAHQEANRVKAAYSRSRFDDDRKELLALWSGYLDIKTEKKGETQ